MDLTMDILGYTWDFEFFVAAFLFGLGLATLGSGLFTAYFGAGKSQQIGFVLIVLAVLVLGGSAMLRHGCGGTLTVSVRHGRGGASAESQPPKAIPASAEITNVRRRARMASRSACF